MDDKAAKSKKDTEKAEDGYVPLDGSWMAELEDAKVELQNLLRRQRKLSSATESSSSSRGADSDNKEKKKKKLRGESLQLHLRLCRAYCKLRLWKELSETSQKGLDVCSVLPTRCRRRAAPRVFRNGRIGSMRTRSDLKRS